jgi:hypothetical protein
MPMVEILDGPPEWAGTQFEGPEEDMAEEIGLSHPGWRGTPVGIRWSALYAYRKVEVVGDRHRYRYVGPWGARPRRLHDGMEDLTGWDVLVVQKELGSDDRRKLWGSPIRVYAAPPGAPRPDPDRLPEEQGWQELTRGAMLRRPRAPGTGALFQERLARLMAEGNPWVVGHWRRLANLEGRPRTPRSIGSRTSSGGWFGWLGRPGSCGGCSLRRCGPGPATRRSRPGRPTSR